MVKAKPNIVIVGTGNVAWHLGTAILSSGHFNLTHFIGRNTAQLKRFKQHFKVPASKQLQLLTHADIIIICITDNQLIQFIHQLKSIPLSNKIIMHTAASVHENELASLTSQYGILYPLQSLKKEIPTPITHVPMGIWGSSQKVYLTLVKLCKSIGCKHFEADYAFRVKLHIAAIFSNNFSNYLYILAQQWCAQNQIDFSLLLPLIQNQIAKLANHTAHSIQTGPATRGDLPTINTHYKLLKQNPELLKFYKLFTTHIGQHFKQSIQ